LDSLRPSGIGQRDRGCVSREGAEGRSDEHSLRVGLGLSAQTRDERQAGGDQADRERLLLGAMQGDDQRLVVCGGQIVQLVEHQGEPDPSFGGGFADETRTSRRSSARSPESAWPTSASTPSLKPHLREASPRRT
jgi:hypothetical protein